VIERFVENIEKAISSSSIVLSSNVQKYFGPALETVYLKGHLLIIDSYPHHKHTPDKIVPSTVPSIKDILNEISAIIIGR
jgi:hypothetical protein